VCVVAKFHSTKGEALFLCPIFQSLPLRKFYSNNKTAVTQPGLPEFTSDADETLDPAV